MNILTRRNFLGTVAAAGRLTPLQTAMGADRRNRRMALPVLFGKPAADDSMSFARARPFIRLRPTRRKIFVIKETIHLRSTNDTDSKIRRVLIFDNHRDSLLLVFGRGATEHLSMPRRVSRLELIIVSIVTIAGLVGMFWLLL